MVVRVVLVGFEDDLGVIKLNNGTIIRTPRSLLPYDAKAGDIIKIRVDKDATIRSVR